jgi:hypothetical protein
VRWFKHFTDNHRGRTVQRLMDEMGPAGALAYYFILEICAEKLEKIPGQALSEAHCVFVFNRKVIQSVTRMKRVSIDNVGRIGSECSVWQWESSGNEIIIKLPILLNLLDRDLKSPRTRRALDAQKPRPDTDEHTDADVNTTYSSGEPKKAFVFPETADQLLEFFTQRRKELEKLYPIPGFIEREAIRAILWLENNPQRKPKNARGIKGFFSRWLGRGWEQARKTIPVNSTHHSGVKSSLEKLSV